MYKLFIFLKRGWLTYTSYRMQVLTQYFSLIFFLVIIYFLSKMIGTNSAHFLGKYGRSFSSFLVVGIIFQWFISISLNSFSRLIREEQKFGTLEFLLFSQTNLVIILVYSSIWNFLKIFFQSTILMILTTFVFGINISFNLMPSIIVLFLTIISISGIGLMSAGVIIAYKQGDPINWVFSVISTFFSGVFFPVDLLPPSLRNISMVLPTTHALAALRDLFILNLSLSSIFHHIVILILFSLVSVPLGTYVYMRGFKKACVSGSLSDY